MKKIFLFFVSLVVFAGVVFCQQQVYITSVEKMSANEYSITLNNLVVIK